MELKGWGLGGQALEALRKLRTEKVQEVKEMKLKLDHLSTHKDSAHRLQTERQEGEGRERAIVAEMEQLSVKIEELEEVGCTGLGTPYHYRTRNEQMVGEWFCDLFYVLYSQCPIKVLGPCHLIVHPLNVLNFIHFGSLARPFLSK